jgi:hypothetical protein
MFAAMESGVCRVTKGSRRYDMCITNLLFYSWCSGRFALRWMEHIAKEALEAAGRRT